MYTFSTPGLEGNSVYTKLRETYKNGLLTPVNIETHWNFLARRENFFFSNFNLQENWLLIFIRSNPRYYMQAFLDN